MYRLTYAGEDQVGREAAIDSQSWDTYVDQPGVIKMAAIQLRSRRRNHQLSDSRRVMTSTATKKCTQCRKDVQVSIEKESTWSAVLPSRHSPHIHSKLVFSFYCSAAITYEHRFDSSHATNDLKRGSKHEDRFLRRFHYVDVELLPDRRPIQDDGQRTHSRASYS